MVALSVSTSQITSPLLTCSPSVFLQRAMVPVSMVGERAIIRIFSATSTSYMYAVRFTACTIFSTEGCARSSRPWL